MLTELGRMVYNKWNDIYYNELERLQKEKNDPTYGEGWCIIDNADFIKGIDDEIGLLIFAYEDGVLDYLRDYEERYGEDTEYIFGFTADDIINDILAEGLIKED